MHGKREIRRPPFFLFRREANPLWSRGRRWLFWTWNIGMVLLSAVGIGLCSMLLALGPYPLGLIHGWLARPVIFALNLLPVLAIALLFYFLTCRPTASFLLTALLVLGLSAGNFFKLHFRDDPVLFIDLFLLKEAGNMAGRYQLFVDGRLAVVLLFVAVGAVFLHFLVRGRPRRKSRLGCTLLLTGVSSLILLTSITADDALYEGKAASFDYLPNRWSSTQQYVAHGFVYPFFHSMKGAFELPPSGYNEAGTVALLGAYQDADIPEDKKVNVIAVMLEAYNDFTKFGKPQLSRDIYKVWHDLEAEGYSGDLLTNIFAAGTVDTERCFLTGYRSTYNFRRTVNAYPWYFRTQGYRVEGMHPCYQWFYNRQNVNAYLGFEDYYFIENYFEPLTGGGVAPDSIFFPELLKTYRDGIATGQPYFNFSLTYQGHGPYDSNRYLWGERGSFVVDDGSYSDAEHCILENYFGSIANTNDQLRVFTDALRYDPEPVVLVLFGDHNPWMGNGMSVYTAMGIDFDMSTQAGFTDYYSTRYLIWANEAAKEVLGNDFQGEGPTIGPYFLMNQLFELCGWQGPAYLQAMTDLSQEVQAIHITDRCLVDGQLIDQPDATVQAQVETFLGLEYYQRQHFLYEDWQ